MPRGLSPVQSLLQGQRLTADSGRARAARRGSPRPGEGGAARRRATPLHRRVSQGRRAGRHRGLAGLGDPVALRGGAPAVRACAGGMRARQDPRPTPRCWCLRAGWQGPRALPAATLSAGDRSPPGCSRRDLRAGDRPGLAAPCPTSPGRAGDLGQCQGRREADRRHFGVVEVFLFPGLGVRDQCPQQLVVECMTRLVPAEAADQ